MRSLTLSLAFVLLGCSGKKSAGPIGQPLDLRVYLPDSLKAGGVADSAFRHQMKVGPDSALVEVTWTPLRHGSSRVLSEVRARLLEPVKYDSITIGEIGNLQNVGTKTDPVESAGMKIRWFKTWLTRPRTGVADFEFDARGRRMVKAERR
jgi:hypothetical protein